MNAFEAVVAEWLRSKGLAVSQVHSVSGNGYDWAGCTEDGFHSEFEVTIRYDESGYRTVDGQEMGDLWSFVVGAWPSRPSSEGEREPS